MTLHKCSDCNQEKSFELMRKHYGKVTGRCSACENIRRKVWRDNRKPIPVEEIEPEPIALPRTFKYKPYKSKEVWVRNNENVHIKSRGFKC